MNFIGDARELLMRDAGCVPKIARELVVGDDSHADFVRHDDGMETAFQKFGDKGFDIDVGHDVGDPERQTIKNKNVAIRVSEDRNNVAFLFDRRECAAALRFVKRDAVGHLGVARGRGREKNAALAQRSREIERECALAGPRTAADEDYLF